MLAVDGQQLGAGIGHRGHENFAGRDEAFLVGEREPASLPRGLEGRLEAGRADDRRHHAVGRLGGGGDNRLEAGGGADAAAGQRRLQLGIAGRIADHGEARARAAGRFRETRRRCSARSAR